MFVLAVPFSTFNFTTNYGHNPLTFSSLLPSNSIFFRSSYSCKLVCYSNAMLSDPNTSLLQSVGLCYTPSPIPGSFSNAYRMVCDLIFTCHRPTLNPIPCMVWAHVRSVQHASWSVLMNSYRCAIFT